MNQAIFHVRLRDDGNGWAIDEYDGRGAWVCTIPQTLDGARMDKQMAQRAVFQLRRKALNSAKTEAPVNKGAASGVPPFGPSDGEMREAARRAAESST